MRSKEFVNLFSSSSMKYISQFPSASALSMLMLTGAFTLLFSLTAQAQLTTGNLIGTVSSADGVIQGATVAVTDNIGLSQIS